MPFRGKNAARDWHVQPKMKLYRMHGFFCGIHQFRRGNNAIPPANGIAPIVRRRNISSGVFCRKRARNDMFFGDACKIVKSPSTNQAQVSIVFEKATAKSQVFCTFGCRKHEYTLSCPAIEFTLFCQVLTVMLKLGLKATPYLATRALYGSIGGPSCHSCTGFASNKGYSLRHTLLKVKSVNAC